MDKLTDEEYQQLTSVIKESCPEIMELKFGCFLKHIECEWPGVITKTPHYQGTIGYEYFTDTWSTCTGTEKEIREEYQILGSPITIANILATIEDKFEKPDLAFINYVGVEKLLEEWAFCLDDLSLQSDETKQWLFSILVNPKTT